MIDRRIKFRHIQSFVEIAQEKSFKTAAAQLHLTQPAISKTLKELEEILDTQLFTRNRGGVVLTDAGARFLKFAKMSLASLHQGIISLEYGQTHAPQILRIGVLPSVAARLLPHVADPFGTAAPDAVLRIVDGPLEHLLSRLREGSLDLVLGRMGAEDAMEGLSFTALYRERVCFAVRPKHPMLARPALEELSRWPVIYPSQASAIRPSVDRFFIENGIGVVPRKIETVSGAFGRIYVQTSDAIWIISESVVANDVDQGLLERLPFNTDTTLGPIGIMAREDWETPAVARLFKGWVRKIVARQQTP